VQIIRKQSIKDTNIAELVDFKPEPDDDDDEQDVWKMQNKILK
jgi:hypothetical protein